MFVVALEPTERGESAAVVLAEALRLSRLEARAREWNAREHVRPAVLRRMDRLSQMIVSACRMALGDAGLALTGSAAEDAGIVLGAVDGGKAIPPPTALESCVRADQ